MYHKELPAAQLKIHAGGMGTLEGYASTWEPFDRVGEKPVRGAFAASLPAFVQEGFLAYGHDWKALPVATVKEAYEDHHGLYFVADFHSIPFAQDVRKTIQE